MIREKSEQQKKSISSRIDGSTYDIMLKASENPNHRFYDRKIAYIVNKVLDDLAQKEK